MKWYIKDVEGKKKKEAMIRHGILPLVKRRRKVWSRQKQRKCDQKHRLKLEFKIFCNQVTGVHFSRGYKCDFAEV